jgi:hypothetical protein
MSQGGYGFDQAYLWFKRDGKSINHDLHISAFITEDFHRMENDTFLGYGKPLLSLKNGLLITNNVPVPTRPYYLPWITSNLPIIKELRVFQLSSKLFSKMKSHDVPRKIIQRTNQTREVISAILKDLKIINQGKNSIGVLVYLPTRDDHENPLSRTWKQFLNSEAVKNGLFLLI